MDATKLPLYATNNEIAALKLRAAAPEIAPGTAKAKGLLDLTKYAVYAVPYSGYKMTLCGLNDAGELVTLDDNKAVFAGRGVRVFEAIPPAQQPIGGYPVTADSEFADAVTFVVYGETAADDPSNFNWFSPYGHYGRGSMRGVKAHSAREALDIAQAESARQKKWATRWHTVKYNDVQLIPTPAPAPTADDEIPF